MRHAMELGRGPARFPIRPSSSSGCSTLINLACAEKCEGKNQYSGTCGGLAENSDKWCEAGDKDKEMYIMVCCANSSSECCDPNIGAIVGIVIAIVVVLAVAITGLKLRAVRR